MTGRPDRHAERQTAAVLIFVVALLATALAYRPALGGSTFFDDAHNLGGLAEISDLSSAVQYIGSGVAGPLGRPIALASFAAQAYAWPDAVAQMLYTNICIHLLNGALVTWMLFLLLDVGRRATQPGRAARVAATSGAIWMLMPLLASSSLMVVQRMTTLSATFVLAGAVGYLYGRSALDRRPRIAVLVMAGALILGTTLAALTKENGALLPLLVLVAELTIIAPPETARARSLRRALLGLLALPAIALAAYLMANAVYSDTTVAYRGFSGTDRVLTQAHILWEYLLNAFVPAAANLGPFHDDHAVYRDWFRPTSMLAVGSWLLMIAAAIALRKRLPMLSFAVGWYLVGHSIESTTIPLELYFEHRNYVPIIGPVLAVVFAADCEAAKVRVIRPALAAYTVLLGLVLIGVTSAWGRPLLAAHMWALYSPESARATQYLAEQYATAGKPRRAYQILQARLEQRPTDVNAALRVIGLGCLLSRNADQSVLLERTKDALEHGGYDSGVVKLLAGLHLVAKEKRCSAVTAETAHELVSAAARNPAYQAVPIAYHDLQLLLADQALIGRNPDVAMRHLEIALATRFSLEALAGAVQALRSAGRVSVALDLLDEARQRRPRNPLRALVWAQQVEKLRTSIGSAAGHD